MEFEELKTLWKASNARLEASARLGTLLLQQSNLGKVQSALGRLIRGVTFELIANVVGVVLLGWYVADRFGQPRFLVPAVALDLYAVALVIANARQLVELCRIDYDEPVVAIQKQIERVRVLRLRTTLWTLAFGPLMWLPIFITGAQLIFGVDVYAVVSPAWLVANALFGFAVIPLAMALARIAAPRLARSSSARFLADEIAGRSLRDALDDLDAISRFAQED